MANPTKQLGTKHESDTVAWLKEHGWPYAHRRTMKGSADEGDICLSERIPFTIEGKTAKATTDRASIGTFIKELVAEVENVGDDAGAVIYKKRGTTDVGEYYAMMPVKYLNHLLLLAYGEGRGVEAEPTESSVRKRLIPRSRS
jgi:hypothetical protein